MKNKVLRMFVIMLALVIALQSTAFAMTGGEQLLKYNMIQTSSEGLKADEILTREQLAKIICELFGESEKAKSLNGIPQYVDIDEMSESAKPYIAYVTDKKWMYGVGNQKFDPKGPVNEFQIGTIILRGMGHEYSWLETSIRLFVHGIAPVKSNLTGGDAYDYIWSLARKPLGKGGESLLSKYGKMPSEEIAAIENSELVKAARTFKLDVVAEGVQKLTDGSGKSYLLVRKGAKIPAEHTNLVQIHVPIERVFVATTPVVSYLNALGPDYLKSVVGVTTKKEEWINPEIVKGLEDGSITYIEQSYDAPINTEAVLKLKPNVVLVDGFNVEQAAKLRESLEKFGVAVLHVTEYKEAYPNALVEWIKFFGALYDANDVAKNVCQQMVSKEKEVFSKAKHLKDDQKVSVAMGYNYFGSVYVAGKDSPIKEQISLLGGNYVFGDIPGGTSVTITPEEFVVKGKDADVLIYTSLPQYLGGVEGLIENFPQIKEFKAYKNNRIYILDKGYYMNKIDEVSKFEDILFILHPELMKNHVLKMYQHLDVNQNHVQKGR